MLVMEIPGREKIEIANVVFDYNGTIAVDGLLLPGVEERMLALKKYVSVFVLTADTYGSVRAQCEHLGVEVRTFPRDGAAKYKEKIVKELHGGVACIGNGFNDIEMFDAALLRIAVLESEGICAALIKHTDILAKSALDAMDLLVKPNRIRATLRS